MFIRKNRFIKNSVIELINKFIYKPINNSMYLPAEIEFKNSVIKEKLWMYFQQKSCVREWFNSQRKQSIFAKYKKSNYKLNKSALAREFNVALTTIGDI